MWLTWLINYWKMALVAVALVVAFGAGWYCHKPQTTAQVAEKAVTQKDVVTTTVKNPDGTVTTTTTDHTKVVATENKSTPVPLAQKQYSLEVRALNGFETWNPNYEISLSRRLFSELWMSGAYNTGHKEVGLGLRWDF